MKDRRLWLFILGAMAVLGGIAVASSTGSNLNYGLPTNTAGHNMNGISFPYFSFSAFSRMPRLSSREVNNTTNKDGKLMAAAGSVADHGTTSSPAVIASGVAPQGPCSCWCECEYDPRTRACVGSGFCCVGMHGRWWGKCFGNLCIIVFGSERGGNARACIPPDFQIIDAAVMSFYSKAKTAQENHR